MNAIMNAIRVLVASALVGAGAILVAPLPAGAAHPSASDFAADCNDDGVVSITSDTTYVGGSADIIGVPFAGSNGCRVDLDAEGIRVQFVNVHLRAKGGAFLNIGQSSLGATSIKIKNSSFDMHPDLEPGGYLSIKTGCCAGATFEEDSAVAIRNSALRGTWVELGASLAASRGRLDVRGTSVQATGDPGLAPDIILRVSSGGPAVVDGRLEARQSVFLTPGGLEARTGAGGDTSMVQNDLTGVAGGITFTTGVGGTCRSLVNTPAVTCS